MSLIAKSEQVWIIVEVRPGQRTNKTHSTTRQKTRTVTQDRIGDNSVVRKHWLPELCIIWDVKWTVWVVTHCIFTAWSQKGVLHYFHGPASPFLSACFHQFFLQLEGFFVSFCINKQAKKTLQSNYSIFIK